MRRPRRRTWKPGQPVITMSQCERLTPGALYWLVTYQGERYWMGRADGPAAHIAHAQAQTLAGYLILQHSAQSGARRRGRVR